MASSVPEDLQAGDITLFTKSDEVIVFLRKLLDVQLLTQPVAAQFVVLHGLLIFWISQHQ